MSGQEGWVAFPGLDPLQIAVDGANVTPAFSNAANQLPINPLFDPTAAWTIDISGSITAAAGPADIFVSLDDGAGNHTDFNIQWNAGTVNTEIDTQIDSQNASTPSLPISPIVLELHYDGAGTASLDLNGLPLLTANAAPAGPVQLIIQMTYSAGGDNLAIQSLILSPS